jgi:peptide/nickel transport system substrate-binding protein
MRSSVLSHIKVNRRSWSVLVVIAGVAALIAALTTGASARTFKANAAASTPTISLVEGTAPQSLDPGLDYTTQGSEVNWLVYTGLTTYSRAGGLASTSLIPGLATSLPKISNGGKTYTVTLHKGLKFSNGTPVVASDFTYTVERALTIPWGGASAFITPYLKGAAAYSTHKSKTISGIKTDNATGKIVMNLTQAYGPWANVLAFPALGIIPSTTPMKVEASTPPPGVGPYMVTSINPNVSFDVVKNPLWASMGVTNIPAGYVNVDVKVSSNVEANALSVINGTADVFDWADTVPGSLLPQIHAKAASRYKLVDLGGSTYYIFLNAKTAPFSNQDAREAVVAGLNENAFNSLGGGTLAAGCFFLPPGIPGHPTSAKCPYGTPGKGNLAKARALVKASGEASTPITVYSEERAPRQQWMTYYQSYLKQIGFKNVTIKQVSDTNYFTTIGESKKVDPQTGFADWNEDFPNPVDFYGPLLNGPSITPTQNENFGQTDDPVINAAVAKLGPIPTTQLGSVVKQWQKVDEYVAKKAYLAVFGYQSFPFFTSSRIVRTPAMINDIYGWDLSELKVK